MFVFEIVLFVLVTMGFLGWLASVRFKENRYLKKRTREALSQELHEEIENERQENIRKSEKFQGLLKRFGGGE